MSIVYGGLERLKIKYPHLEPSKLKIIGWGAGQWFRDYYPHLNIPVSYTVCPIKENHGKVINGVEVKSPDELRLENPENIVIIVIASHSNEIINQILNLGNFHCVPAFKFGTDDISHILELQSFAYAKPIKLNTTNQNHDAGFFYQGPINSYTEICLKYQRIKFPTDYHCLVTYTNQNQSLISKCAQWVDDVIQVEDPINPGLMNRNRMIRTSSIGAHAVHRKKCEYTIRVRTGNIVIGDLSSFIFDIYRSNQSNQNKVCFFMGQSWRNIPFHIADTFMVARSHEMIRLWDVQEDSRTVHSTDFTKVTDASHFTELYKLTNEVYLWTNYANKLGYTSYNLRDYYEFMTDNLIPLEPKLSTISLKHIPLVNLDYDNGFSPDVSWWKSLKFNFENEYQRAMSRQLSHHTIQDFWSAKIG